MLTYRPAVGGFRELPQPGTWHEDASGPDLNAKTIALTQLKFGRVDVSSAYSVTLTGIPLFGREMETIGSQRQAADTGQLVGRNAGIVLFGNVCIFPFVGSHSERDDGQVRY